MKGEVIAVVVESRDRAHEVLHRALDLQTVGSLVVHDAVVVDRRAIEHDDDAVDPAPVALAVPSSLLGALVGVIVGGPLGFLVGSAFAGGIVALIAKLAEGHFTRAALQDVRALADDDKCVLALLVSEGGDAAFGELAAIAGSAPVRLRAA